MVHRRLALAASLALPTLLVTAACTPRVPDAAPGPVAAPLREALGEGQCRIVPTRATPLVLDWKSHERADLEEAMRDGLAVVAYDCKTLRVLSGCKAPGTYGFMGVERKTDTLQLADADEIRANLPTFGATFVGEMSRGSSLDLAYVMVGKRRTAIASVPRDALEKDPACAGATHFVRGAYLGAFAMTSGEAGKVRAAAEIFGFGAGGQTQGSKTRASRDGDPKACEASTAASDTPPPACGSPIRLELVALGERKGDVEVGRCPEGLTLVGGKCTAAPAAVAEAGHLCDPDHPADCETQCLKGNLPSCGFHAYALHYGLGSVPRDLAQAGKLYKKACDGGVEFACSGLGIFYSSGEAGFPRDLARSLALHTRACDHGDARGCVNVGVAYEYGRSVPKDLDLAVSYARRACAGGQAMGCANLGTYYERQKAPSLKADPEHAKELYAQACHARSAGGCTNLASLYYRGVGVRQDRGEAARLRRDACSMDTSDKALAACQELAAQTLAGDGVAKDVPGALALYERACLTGRGNACWVLANLHRDGAEVPKSDTAANALLEEACRKDVGDACSVLGYAYEKGLGLTANLARAEGLYQKACVLHSSVGCFNVAAKKGPYARETAGLYEEACETYAPGCRSLGGLYEYGRGVARDADRARSLYEKGCAMGDGASCADYARATPNSAKAFEVTDKACEAKSAESCEMAARLALSGTGTAKSVLRAADLAEHGCAAGSVASCELAARLYDSGGDLPRDEKKATGFRMAGCFASAPKLDFSRCKAEWGPELCAKNKEGCTQFAYKLAQGKQGLKKDPAQALRLWAIACDAGHPNGCWGLADAHASGWGVPKSLAKARTFWAKACKAGEQKACGKQQ